MKLMIAFYFILITTFASAFDINKLDLLMEEYPPINFSINGKPMGISVEILKEVFKGVGVNLSEDSIKILPWARAYTSLERDSNKLMLSMTETPERAKLFKFVGPFYGTRIVLLAKKSRKLKIKSFDDLKKYRIGVVNMDIGETLLLEKGFPKDKIDYVTRPIQNAQKLSENRIDLWAYEESVANYAIGLVNLNPDDFETVYVLKEGVLSFALSKDVPDETIRILQNSLDKVMNSAKYKEIISRYTK